MWCSSKERVAQGNQENFQSLFKNHLNPTPYLSLVVATYMELSYNMRIAIARKIQINNESYILFSLILFAF